MLTAWVQFLACSAAIAISGYFLARYGDAIAEKTQLGGTWIGVVLLATVTSLPELVTGVSSVTLIDAPDIAVGDVMGSCVFNLVLIAVLDFMYREMPLYQKTSNGHILSAGFGVILIGLVVFSLLSGDAATVRIGHVGIYTPAILVLYLVAVRAIYVQERRFFNHSAEAERYPGMTLRQAFTGYAAAGLVVVAAGIAMPFVAVALADSMGWGQTFVGTLLVAAATSLPEAASTLSALRLGAVDLAIGNLLGSNLFNILVIAIDDLAYQAGPLLSRADPSHAVTGASAIIMTGIAIVGLHYRPATRVFRVMGWSGLALVLVYILNSMTLFLRGH